MVLIFIALIGYVVYTTVTTQSEFALGYYVGLVVFFAVLIVTFRFVGRWGCLGTAIRAGCGALAVLKILTLVAHPPPT